MNYKDKLLFLVFVLFILFYNRVLFLFLFLLSLSLLNLWLRARVQLRNRAINDAHHLLPWLQAATPPQWLYQKCMGIAIALFMGLNNPLPVSAIPVSHLCAIYNQSCMLLESDLLLNWESLRSQCQC